MAEPESGPAPHAAALVHVFTALGVVCALFAVLAISAHAYEKAFIWLGVAFFIDALDGILARRLQVKKNLPRFSGEALDSVIDYLTYVFVPVLALLSAEFLKGPIGIGLAALILLSALFHFADTESKSAELAFIGFPAIWNVVAFYLFAFTPSQGVTTAVILLLVALTFVRLPWAHPVRVVALRWFTLSVALVWTVTAIAVLWHGFPATLIERVSLAAVIVYAVALSLFWRRLPGH